MKELHGYDKYQCPLVQPSTYVYCCEPYVPHKVKLIRILSPDVKKMCSILTNTFHADAAAGAG